MDTVKMKCKNLLLKSFQLYSMAMAEEKTWHSLTLDFGTVVSYCPSPRAVRNLSREVVLEVMVERRSS